MFGLLLSLVLSLGLSAAACTYEQILLCEQHIILGQQGKPRDCNSEEVPSYDELAPAPDTCCPSCHNEPRPYCMYLSSELCAANEEPTTSEDSGCLSCFHACKATNTTTTIPRDCELGEEPHHTSDCSLSCQPRCQNTPEKTAACAESIDELPSCPTTTDMHKVFNTSSCCPVCNDNTYAPTVCSVDDFTGCIGDPNKRECASGEVAVPVENTCCLSCRRVERKTSCHPEDVGRCMAGLEVCASGEAPVSLQGGCCPSCQPARVLCGEDCTAAQICARAPRDRARCREPRDSTHVFTKRNSAAAMTTGEHAAMIKEMAVRYCERLENAPLCDAFLPALIDGLSVPVNRTVSEEDLSGRFNFTLRVLYPEVTAPVVFQNGTQANQTLGNLLGKVFKDSEVTGSMRIYDPEPAVVENAADRVHCPLLLLVGLVALVVL